MRTAQFVLFLCVSLVFVLQVAFGAGQPITVNEAGIKASVDAGAVTLSIPIQNGGSALPARVSVDLIDPSDHVVTSATAELSIPAGTTAAAMSLPLVRKQEGSAGEAKLLWSRLRYVVSAADTRPAEGIVSLAAVAPDLFEAGIAHSWNAIPGTDFRLRIHAANPVTHRPVAGVSITANIDLDQPELAQPALTAVTNTAGDALLIVPVPKSIEADEFEIEIQARKGTLLQTNDLTPKIVRNWTTIVSTDKPLYQPGQQLHIRTLLFGGDRRAVPEQMLTFFLKDPDGELVFQGKDKTNSFGIASVDWELPESLRLGYYSVEVGIGDDYSSGPDSVGQGEVRVSRYELPSFVVSVHPDRKYYLPGQDADLDVKAEYLFGKPVTRGEVNIVRESSRHWNYAQQKWETEEEEKYEGRIDDTGHFKLHLELNEIREKELTGHSQLYRDLTYAAYVTDGASGRTEQRRFTLRLSRDPIHVYVIDQGVFNGRELLYVTTFYPDGTPAQCKVEISELDNDADEDAPAASLKHGPVLASLRTNRFGIGKAENVPLGKDAPDSGYRNFFFSATDDTGRKAYQVESMWRPENAIVLKTSKTIYRSEEPIHVTVNSIYKDASLVLDLVAETGAVIASQRLRLRNGNGFAVFPYRPEFVGELMLAAYSLEQLDGENRSGATAIVYPRNRELSVKMRPERKNYRPGDEFGAAVQVRTAEGAGVASALGVSVIDKAVEERDRTDSEFGGRSSFSWNWTRWYGWNAFSSFSRRDLNNLDLSKPIPEDVQVAAEMLLPGGGFYYNLTVDGYDFDNTNNARFRNSIEALLTPVQKILDDERSEGWSFPKDVDGLRRLLSSRGIDLDKLKDPWAMPFRFEFGSNEKYLTVQAVSAGPDKRFGSSDDISEYPYRWRFFTPLGNKISRAICNAYNRDNTSIRDYAALSKEVAGLGVDLDAQRDPKGNRYDYEFKINGPNLEINVYSQPRARHYPYRSSVWTAWIDYFAQYRQRIDRELATSARFPTRADQLENVLHPVGLAPSQLRDPWGNPYYATFARSPIYADQTVLEVGTGKQSETKPVTRTFDEIVFHSAGPDGKPQTDDDFSVSTHLRMVSEQSGAEIKPQQKTSVPLIAGKGALSGMATDPSGAAIPNANVRLFGPNGAEQSGATNGVGRYLFRNLDPGLYRIEISATGFITSSINGVVVDPDSESVVNFALRLSGASQTITVEANPIALQTDSSEQSSLAERKVSTAEFSDAARAGGSVQNYTPRIREYFPETLYWAPSLLTGRAGSTRLDFKLADSITTWKFNLVASTADGRVGSAEAEITAFQPFFVDHTPPRILTVGDKIQLPVVIRNYLEKPQAVDVEMKPANWMTLLGNGTQSTTVPSGEFSKVIFPFRAERAVVNGKQRVTAANQSLGDAIDKPVTVHPDGQEIANTVSAFLTGEGRLQFEIPTQAISGSLKSELKVYPNLLSHLADAIEGSMQRPWGCGEQTISSTYPSLLLLRYYRDHKLPEDALSRRAHKYLEQGYQRLLGYRREDGGFGYWGTSGSDAALTAYALRFLHDAAEFLSVDKDAVGKSRTWLLQQQSENGSWRDWYRMSAATTAHVGRMLAMTAEGGVSSAESQAQERVRAYLATSAEAALDPYIIAEEALTALARKDTQAAGTAIARLKGMAHHEAQGAFWELQTNTTFYGWGTAGRLETTALVLQALALSAPDRASTDPLISDGLRFLLKERDRYGVWYSGQATVNVLDTLLLLLRNASAVPGSKIIVKVNGNPARVLELPKSQTLNAPLRTDLSPWMTAGDNLVELAVEGGQSTINAIINSTYYIPWDKPASTREVTEPGDSRGLRLAVRYDKTQAKPDEEIRCRVEAERIGHRGYGMLLAEIGLPPGAEVDRAFLNKAIQQGQIDQYDVLPDRIVVYLWPRAGGTNFDFTFRMRFGLKAKSASSILYDYYNPEAQVTVPPEDFKVE